jgi:hypothetical protein
MMRSRVVAPSEEILKTYRESGATGVVPHKLTDAEWATLDAAIAALPTLHKQILQKNLRHLSFVDAPSGAGNALTQKVKSCNGNPMFDIALRSELFHDTLTNFLNTKEATVFMPDASGYSVHMDAGDMPVLTYILLHEGTHGVDKALGLTARGESRFRAGIWADKGRTLAPPYDTSLISKIVWRGGSKLPLGEAPALYAALSKTPFVSLYSAANAVEDLAETVAWEQLSTRFAVNLVIRVTDREGKQVYSYEPLKSPLVRARFPVVEDLLGSVDETPRS